MLKNNKDFDFWADGIERGRKMLNLVEKEIGSLEEKRILDLGCGLGGISISFKERCSQVFSLDSDRDRIDGFRKRLLEKNIKGIFPLQAEAMDLPFLNDSFDLVVINGVLEWVGWGKDKDPLPLQNQVLSEAERVIKRGGFLYLAIENRFYPLNFFRDPHLKIPFVTILPYKVSGWFAYFIRGRPYQTPIHSYWRLKKMLKKAGFVKIFMYTGLIHYQYPVLNIALDKGCPRFLKRQDIIKIVTEYRKFNLKKGLSIKVLFLKIIFLLGVARFFVHNFIILAIK